MSYQETERPEQPPATRVGRCGLTSEGITIAGYHFSWLLVALIVILVFLLFKQDTFESMFGENTAVVAVPRESLGISRPVVINPPPSTSLRAGPSGDIARMFRHDSY